MRDVIVILSRAAHVRSDLFMGAPSTSSLHSFLSTAALPSVVFFYVMFRWTVSTDHVATFFRLRGTNP